ncbi:MAG: TetR/AcrR family transcriptional regulator, partial [Chloroflexota bacterium]
AAQHFFYTKGYDQTSVQDIIDQVGIAKGTFYHHFDSKQDVLEALIQRIALQTGQALEPIVAAPKLGAIEKFNRFFTSAGQFKLENKDALLAIWGALYGSHNALLREKTRAESLQEFSPLLARVIRQGLEEGCFTNPDPEMSARIVLQIGSDMTHALVQLFLQEETTSLETIQRTAAAHEEAIARVLGAPSDSIQIAPIENFRPWFELTAHSS